MKMIISKTICLILIPLLFCAVDVNAQNKEKFTVDSLVRHRTLSMKKVLILDSAQTAKIAELNKELLQKLDDISSSKKAADKRANDTNDAKDKYEKNLAKVLTNDQFTRYKVEEDKRTKDFEKTTADKKIPVKKAG